MNSHFKLFLLRQKCHFQKILCHGKTHFRCWQIFVFALPLSFFPLLFLFKKIKNPKNLIKPTPSLPHFLLLFFYFIALLLLLLLPPLLPFFCSFFVKRKDADAWNTLFIRVLKEKRKKKKRRGRTAFF